LENLHCRTKGRRIRGRTPAKLWVAAGLAGMVFLGAWLKHSPGASGSSTGAPPAALPQVVVNKLFSARSSDASSVPVCIFLVLPSSSFALRRCPCCTLNYICDFLDSCLSHRSHLTFRDRHYWMERQKRSLDMATSPVSPGAKLNIES
jgi:hypothetical protein